MLNKIKRFDRLKISNEVIYVDRNKPLSVFISEPFPASEQRLNFYYLKLAYCLNKNNKLCFETVNGDVVPYNKEALINHIQVSRQYFDTIFRRLCHSGIIMQVRVFNIIEYYINPRFAFYGEEIPSFLLKMFDYDADKIYGEHMFDIKNTIYERRTSEYNK